MRHIVRAITFATLVLGLSGCWRFGAGEQTWAERTQDRFADLILDANPFPAVGWPTEVDSPYERAMASISLYAADPRSRPDDAAERDAFAKAWDDATGAFVQDGIPPLDVSEVVWRALTHDGRTPFRGPGSEALLVDLAAESLQQSGDPLDVWESLIATRLLMHIADHGARDDVRAAAAAALDSYETERACNAASGVGWSTSEVAALVSLVGALGRACPSYPLDRARVDRELATVLDELTPAGGIDPGGLVTVTDGSLLADVGLADPALVEQGVDAMMSLATDDAFDPDPRNALDVADLADRAGRRVAFGPRMLQMLRATVWAGGAIPDDARPDAGSLLALADTFALLPGGPDRSDLAKRVDWDSPSMTPYDRILVTLAADPGRLAVDDLEVPAGMQTDLGSAPLVLRAAEAAGGCPSPVRYYAEHHVDLLRGADPEVLVRDALPPHLRDLAALRALTVRCDLAAGDTSTGALWTAIDDRLDDFRGADGLYGIYRHYGGEPDVEVTAVSIEARCHLGEEPAVPRDALLGLVARRENVEGGTEDSVGGVSLFATLAAAESLAFADGGCSAMLRA